MKRQRLWKGEMLMIKAKDYLKQVEKLDKMIKNKILEVKQWKAIATGSVTSSNDAERVQSSGNQQKMADAVCRYVALEAEIDSAIDKLIDTKKDVINTIEKLPATEYDVLHKVYIQYWTLEMVADDYKKSYAWATSVHGRALKMVQNILDAK